MVRSMLVMLVVLGAQTIVSANNCFYDGQNRDDRKGELTHFTGEFTCKDSDTGVLVLRERHKDGKKDGAYATYDFKTGAIEEEGFYRNDKYQGVRKVYHQGKISEEYAYADGELLGVQKSYDEGKLTRVYLMSGESTPDTELMFNKNGQLTSLKCGASQISVKDATWCGRAGQLSTVSLYSDNGKLVQTEQYLWGKLHGLSRRFSVETGKVRLEERYENGIRLQEGQTVFDSSGTVAAKTDCDQARKKCSDTVFFEDSQKKKSVKTWMEGQLAGETDYYQNGKISRSIEKTGETFLITEYYDTGIVSSKGTYIAAIEWYWNPYIPDGVVESFGPGGSLWRKETYRSGRLDGKSDYYWKMQGHDVHEESEFNKDRIVKRKIDVDHQPVCEYEYMPDGSIKSRKILSKPPVEGMLI